MSCTPASKQSIEELRKLRDAAYERGDECLSTLLAGVDLYVALGREIELLDVMRQHAVDLREAVENTPSADDLRRLYDDPDPSEPV